MPAICDLSFSAVAVEVVHPDPGLAVAELRRVGRASRTRKPKLLADDSGLRVVELVVADRAPLAQVEDLDVALQRQVRSSVTFELL